MTDSPERSRWQEGQGNRPGEGPRGVGVASVLLLLVLALPLGAGAQTTCTADSVAVTVPGTPDLAGLVADCTTLLGLKDTLRGTATLNWAEGIAMTAWDGIFAGATPPRVTELRLTSKALDGTIPAELGDLRALTVLLLNHNALSGPIPAALGELPALRELRLNNNALSGPIPAALGELSDPADLNSPAKLAKLQYLLLNNNALSGEIPDLKNLPALQYLYLDHNALSGPIPAALGELPALQHLWLNDNALSGSIPATLGELPALQYLYLHSNNLSEPIPAELGQLSALIDLYLHDNNLSGSIPAELGNLLNLQRLYLYNNNLSGAIPDTLGNLSNLQSLWLYSNALSGPIPAALGQLSSLIDLDLYNNALSGAIPAALGELSDPNDPDSPAKLAALQRLYLDRNALSGAIPAELGNLTGLQHLYLSHNALSGAIPAELGNLFNLQRLYLYNNALSGPIPSALGDLAALQYLYLNNNALSGSVPPELVELETLLHLRLHNNADLRGDLPTGFATALTMLQELAVQNTQVTVPDDPTLQTWLDSDSLTFTTGTQESSGTIPLDAANTAPQGLWSDGTTLWVADSRAHKLYAYRLADGSRKAARDIPLDAANTVPQGLWSDGTTLWVADIRARKLYAYRLADGSRAKDIALQANESPRGLWSDGTTLWVANYQSTVYAYTLADSSRAADRDIALHANNMIPRGLWSDGTMLWVADSSDARLYAYTLADGSHAPDAYRILDPATTTPFGIWSNGVTWWVADFRERTVYIYGPNQESGAVGTLPAQVLGVGGNAPPVSVTHVFRSPDATLLQYTATSSDEMVATVAVSGTEVTVQPVGVGTTTITVMATSTNGANQGATQRAGVVKYTPRAEEVVATQRFEVTVESGPPPNQGPQAVGMLPDLTLLAGASARLVAVGEAFWDPDGDGLTYTAESSIPRIATVTVSGAEVRVHPQAEGITVITVTAMDTSGANQTATQRFQVTVTKPPPPPRRPPVTGGGSSGGGGSSSRDRHGNTPARATQVRLGGSAPWRSSTTGQVNTTRDVDYFRLTVPRAGVLVVETTGSTDTVGTVWQAGVELGMADSGGARRNFRLSVPVEAGPVVIAVTGTGRTGAYRLETHLVVGYLENPGDRSFQSGIGVLSGWVCDADEVVIELNGTPQVAAYGTERLDTAGVCGDTDNGFGLLFNWNLLRDGEHEVVAFVDGVELGRATVMVTTLGQEFLRNVTGTCEAEDFPTLGETVTLVWQQNSQNFVIAGGNPPAGANPGRPSGLRGFLENPGHNSFQSGVRVLSGWVCDAETVELAIGTAGRQGAAYGTERVDTLGACGNTDNGFGLLFNWNRLGDGEHTVIAYVDNVELGRATVRVTTVGEGAEEEFLRGAEGECVVEDFPMPGEKVTLEWQQNSQNFVITDVE